MALEQPAADDKLNSPSHSLMHRILAIDASAAVQSLQIDAGGKMYTPSMAGFASKRSGCISWKDADEIYIEPNCAYVKDKVAFWTSQLTKQLTSLSNNTWYYIYLDYSAITAGTAVTNTEVIYSTTAPSYDNTYQGWYNTDDRCIGAVLTDGSGNLLGFYWINDMYYFKDPIQELSGGSQTTYTDIDITSSVPNFGRMNVELTARITSVAQTSAHTRVRPNGESWTTHFRGAYIAGASGNLSTWGYFQLFTDTSRVIEYLIESGTADIYVLGFNLLI